MQMEGIAGGSMFGKKVVGEVIKRVRECNQHVQQIDQLQKRIRLWEALWAEMIDPQESLVGFIAGDDEVVETLAEISPTCDYCQVPYPHDPEGYEHNHACMGDEYDITGCILWCGRAPNCPPPNGMAPCENTRRVCSFSVCDTHAVHCRRCRQRLCQACFKHTHVCK